MWALARKTTLLFLLIGAFLLGCLPARASHLRGANIWWQGGDPGEAEGSVRIYFSVEIAYEGNPVLTVATFDYGDGTSESHLFEPVFEHPGWYVGRAIFHHDYAPGTVVEAGLETCCRINGTHGLDLNNGSFGPLVINVQVDLRVRSGTDPAVGYIRWLSGGLGDTFEIPNPISGSWDSCRLSTQAEMGGVPLPDGLTMDPDTCTLIWTPVSGDPEKAWAAQMRVVKDGVGNSTLDFLLALDADRPLCRVERIEPGPPTRIHVRVQDPRSGVYMLWATQAVNTTVQYPRFGEGATVPLTVVGTKIDQNKSSRLELLVTDLAGNETACDPVFTEVVRETGRPERHVYTGIPAAERFVTVLNGDPGLRALAVEVNGRKFQMTGLRPGEERTLDVGSAVSSGETSTVALTAHGKPGGRAVVMIWDGL